MKRRILFTVIILGLFILVFCSAKTKLKLINNGNKKNTLQSNRLSHIKTGVYSGSFNLNQMNLLNRIRIKYKNSVPSLWGEKIDGIITKISTKEKIIALTFDACGGSKGDRYDEKLVSYLIKEKIPATMFLNARWIDANLNTFKMLSDNQLFEIENHGYMHKPLSVNGRSAYKIKGTKNIDEVINEVYLNEQKILKLTGRKPKYFRSGTAYYDDIAVKIVRELGEKPVNFNIIGDAGATFSVDQIMKACSTVKPGSIIIFHMNQPKGSTAEGLMKVIPFLKNKGFKFVHLEEYNDNLK